MFKTHARKSLTAAALGALLLLTACSESPDKLVASAREAIAKRDLNTASIHLKNALQQDSEHVDARLVFADVLSAQGDVVGAERELRKALDAGAKADRAVPQLVAALVAQGKADKAIEEFAATRLEDADAQSRLAIALGNAYLSRGSAGADEAAARFEAALLAKPGAGAAEVGKVRIQLAKQKPDEALVALDAILARQPDNLEALLLKSDVLQAQGKVEEAIVLASKAREVAPDDRQPLLRLVSMYMGAGKGEEADKVLARLREVAPNDVRTVYFGGVSALRADKLVEARDAAEKILRVMPAHDLALMLGASANLRLGDAKQAEAMLIKVVAQRKDWLLPRRMLAQTYLSMRDPARALEVIKPALEMDPRDVELLNMSGQAYMLQADYNRAAEFFGKVASQVPDSPSARTRLGMARMAAGDEARALQDLEAAASSDENKSILAEVAIIASQLRKGENAKALQGLEVLEKKQPDSGAVANIRGAVLLAVKDNAGARKAFERAMELQTENLGALTQLTRLDVTEDKVPAARARLEAFTQKYPKNIRAALTYAQFLQETQAPLADARAALDKAIAADPSRNEARMALVQLLLRNGDGKQALSVAQQAVASQPDSPELLRLLGRTQLAAGEKLQAVQTFGKLQSADPQNATALFELAEAQRINEDQAGAEANLRRALELRPDLAEAAQRLATIYVKTNRKGEALQLAKSVQKSNPDSPVGFMLEGDVFALDKRWPEVSAAMQQAWQRSKAPQVLIGYRAALTNQGKSAEAKKLVDDYLKANPKDGVVRMQIADEALVAGRHAEAFELYKTLKTLAPNNIIVLNNLAWVANKLGDARALEHAENALKAAPKVPAVMETAGTIFVERGQAPRGLALIKEAVQLAPKVAGIRLGYARALARTGDKAAARSEADKALAGLEPGNAQRAEIEAFLKTL